ncbi:hypothetical protein ACV07N_01890 [Roseivirga echinicomitans]
MKVGSLLMLILGVTILMGCENAEQRNNLQQAINDLKVSESFNIVLVMEQAGCTTCLYKANEFFEDNRSEQKILYVFTGYHSLKQMKLKYNLTGNEKNILFDHKSVFYKNKVQLDYPSILYLSDRAIVDYEIAGIDNFSAYSRLRSEIVD